MKNILSCQQLQEKEPELYSYIERRYSQLHSSNRNPNPSRGYNQPPHNPPTPPIVNRPDQPMKRENIPISVTPDQRPPEAPFNPAMQRPNIPGHPPMGISNTPTQPGKYFTPDHPPMGTWNPQHQMNSGRTLYQPPNTMQPPPRTIRPMGKDNFSLGPPAEPNATPKALNPMSKDFKPKTQQVQEYLKKEEMKLPDDFMDELNTTLNMTGTDKCRMKARQLEEKIEDGYIESMVHHIVVKRAIDADDKRLKFYSEFFHAMENKNILEALIQECIQVILRIIVKESFGANKKNDISIAASNPIKNISVFLGTLTLYKSKPLLTKDLDLKQLLIEAFQKK